MRDKINEFGCFASIFSIFLHVAPKRGSAAKAADGIYDVWQAISSVFKLETPSHANGRTPLLNEATMSIKPGGATGEP
jgi:hypothetical protein